jgi:hypothetical protein
VKQRIRFIAIILFSIATTAAATAAYTAPRQPETRIETDQKSGAILFIVKGREEARIDDTGLHVRHEVEYGGSITAVGVSGYDLMKAAAAHAQ